MIALAVPAFYLAAMVGAELLTTFVTPLGGIICYLFILLFLIVNSTLARMQPVHRFYLALGIVPLIRIVSLAVPLSQVSQVYWYLIVAVPVVVGALAIAGVLRIRLAEIGLTGRAIGFQAAVAFFGVTIALVDHLILKPEPLIESLTWHEIIVPALVLLVATGFAEELAFRGVLQRAAVSLGDWGWIYVAVVSSILQIGQHSVLHWLLALGVALLFGWVVRKTGSILGVSLAHGLANICLYLVFPFVF